MGQIARNQSNPPTHRPQPPPPPPPGGQVGPTLSKGLTPTYTPQNDPLVGLIILNTHVGFFEKKVTSGPSNQIWGGACICIEIASTVCVLDAGGQYLRGRKVYAIALVRSKGGSHGVTQLQP